MTADSRAELIASVRAFASADPDPVTRAELEDLLARGRWDELAERFAGPLTFGTAGLRGVVGAGPSRMNAAVVERTTRAVAEYLLRHRPDARSCPVVVGRDARTSSAAFARVAISVFEAAGIPARYFDAPVPTPLVAFAARELGAAAAVVITASHNPAEYNGYKLYGPDAIQITAPVDAEIEAIASHLTPLAATPPGASPATLLGPELEERYLESMDLARLEGTADRSLSIVYTPLHGVGGRLARRALAAAGFAEVVVVPEQVEPDGEFPTVRSPNPEEPEALDRALSLARQHGADLVLANDPDADRLAVCVPAGGSFRALTGNQIGVLLADFVLRSAPGAPRPLVVSTVVSSPMIELVARAHAARYETTLTGFKWIWSAALNLERTEGVRFAFGCEEAIGFSIGGAVRDKDGISAAVFFAELAARCRAERKSLLDRLGELYLQHGIWASAQHSVTLRGEDGVRAIAAAVDAAVAAPPASLAGRPVQAVVDLRQGAEKRPPWLSASPVVRFDLGGGERVLLRPSGTEPKLKIYADLKRSAASPSSLWTEEASLVAEAHAAAVELGRHLGLP